MFDLMNHLTRDDAEARANAFMSMLIEEIANDEETYQKKCRQLARALSENDAEGVIIALCGWSPRSIATKAMLIRDTAQEFHDDDFFDSEIIVEWSNGDTTEGNCTVNPATHEVKDFNPEIMRHEGATIKCVTVTVPPDGDAFLCFAKSEVVFDEDAFWYADPCDQVADDVGDETEQDKKWEAKHISEIRNGDIVRHGDELYLATSDAYLTDTLIGKEWNFAVVGGTEEHLYATTFESAMVDVLLPGQNEWSFVANADLTPIQDGKFGPSVSSIASMTYVTNGNYIELDIVNYCGRPMIYCERSAINEDYADEMTACEFNLSQMSPEALRDKMVAICQYLCEGKTLCESVK